MVKYLTPINILYWAITGWAIYKGITWQIVGCLLILLSYESLKSWIESKKIKIEHKHEEEMDKIIQRLSLMSIKVGLGEYKK